MTLYSYSLQQSTLLTILSTATSAAFCPPGHTLTYLSPHFSTWPYCNHFALLLSPPALLSRGLHLPYCHNLANIMASPIIHIYISHTPHNTLTMVKLPPLFNKVVQTSLQDHSEVHVRSAVEARSFCPLGSRFAGLKYLGTRCLCTQRAQALALIIVQVTTDIERALTPNAKILKH
jgi:hypothetical protein